ncbi:DUF2833 domain-containing protein [Acinetobacter baumannii]|uniref:phage protein Gp13 family protein n=1 Tax=Acinetobacter baumannii TaxID=470 RepID=UPI0018FFC53E|nr:phage protein Gp13 family protein [Acinetobacter baumannii]MBJ9706889.1 DUF2833 domain-containing protein [Acinetobacter baumannii]
MRRNNIEIRKPTERDIRILVENLRDADKDEMKAYFNDNFHWMIKMSIKHSSDAWTVVVNGKLLFICGVGVSSLIGNVGCPWLLGTNYIKQYPFEFYKQCQSILKEMRSEYAVLVNHVYEKNKNAIRFLKRLGFDLKKAEPYGANNKMFHPFVMGAL